MNEQQLKHILARNPGIRYEDRIGFHAKVTVNDTSRRKVRHAKPERDAEATLDKVAERKASCVRSAVVRFIGYRCRPVDPDNFAGSTKDLLDGLRRAFLIPDDSPTDISLETHQVKVKTRKEERTEIVITYL